MIKDYRGLDYYQNPIDRQEIELCFNQSRGLYASRICLLLVTHKPTL